MPMTPVPLPRVASLRSSPLAFAVAWQPAHLVVKIFWILLATVLLVPATPSIADAADPVAGWMVRVA